MPCRTGFEKTVAQRSGEMFSATASGNGVVEFVNKKVIRINYENGETISYQIGRRYGNWSGKVIPHNLVTKLRVGDKVKENDIIYYNELFFQDDIFSVGGADVALKMSVLGRVAFLEVKETLEDGNGASAEFVEKLETTDCKTKYISVPFEYEVKNLVSTGDTVNDETILCTIMPPTSESLMKFEEQAAETLQRLSVDSPKAKFNGTVEEVRVYYAGDMSEMTPSLALLTEKSNTEIMNLARAMKEPAMDGNVPVGTRINGKVVPQNTAIIEIRMVGSLKMKSGDKLVVGSNMKSIIGKIYDEAPISEDGKPIDISFSNAGIFNRMVQSCFLMGAINTTMLRADEEMLEIYFGESK